MRSALDFQENAPKLERNTRGSSPRARKTFLSLLSEPHGVRQNTGKGPYQIAESNLLFLTSPAHICFLQRHEQENSPLLHFLRASYLPSPRDTALPLGAIEMLP